MKSKVHQDIYIGIFLLLFCTIFLLLARSIKPGAQTLPLMVLYLMIILSGFILINGIKMTKSIKSGSMSEKIMFDVKNMAPALKAYAYIICYIILFFLTGFFISTSIFLISFMYILGAENKRIIVLTTTVFLLIVYFIFVKQLNVPVLGFGKIGRLFL